jgi:hypothetical protein
MKGWKEGNISNILGAFFVLGGRMGKKRDCMHGRQAWYGRQTSRYQAGVYMKGAWIHEFLFFSFSRCTILSLLLNNIISHKNAFLTPRYTKAPYYTVRIIFSLSSFLQRQRSPIHRLR